MDKRTEKKPRNLATIVLDPPPGPFFKTMFFNRFGLESLGEHKLFHFGLMRAGGEALDTCTCVVPGSCLAELKSSWMDYLGKIGELPDDDVNFTWKPSLSKNDGTFFTNVAQVARTGDLGEFRFYNYSMGFAWERRRVGGEATQKIVPQPQGLFVSDLKLHLAIIVKLFESP